MILRLQRYTTPKANRRDDTMETSYIGDTTVTDTRPRFEMCTTVDGKCGCFQPNTLFPPHVIPRETHVRPRLLHVPKT